MAVNGPVAVLFDDEEYKTPGSSPLWGIGTLDEAHADFTGFECMPRRPYHFKSLSLSFSFSLSAGAGRDIAKSATGLSSPVPDQQRSCVFRWFSNSTSLICLLESWRRQPCAGQPKPRRTGSRNPALVLASEQQQSSASILTMPQQQNQQAGT